MMSEERGRGVLAGHMRKALRQIKENLWLVDVVLEVADARAPTATRNPALDRLVGRKARILILNKADLAAEEPTRRWLAYFRRGGLAAEAVSAADGSGLARLQARLAERGNDARAMIVGVPNVGKSSLINRLAGGARTRTGARPGITRGKQWVRVDGVMLLDLAGVLPPFLRNRTVLARLAALDVVGADAFARLDAAVALIDDLRRLAPREMELHYGIQSELGEAEEVLTDIGRRRGCLLQGGRVDVERAAEMLLKDFRGGKLGRVTLEEPPTEENPT